MSKKPKRRALAKTEIAPSILKMLNIQMPSSIETEEVVLGGLMLDKNGYDFSKQFLTTSDIFFLKKHQTVFRAIQKVISKNLPIDLITVNETIKKMGLMGDAKKPPQNLKGRKLAEFISFCITPLELVELTNRVASTANIEAHSAILHQLYLRRRAVEKSLTIVKEAADLTKDVLELYEQALMDFRTSSPSKVIQLKTMNQAMAAGATAPPSKWIAGNLFKENEICILFADAGDGKSVFAFQVADAVSKGEPIFRHCDHPDFINQSTPKLTHFYDFELEEPELWSRYSERGEGYEFSENLIRGALNPSFMDFENADELIAKEIERDIEIHKPEFVVIDNLTYIISESQDSTIASKLMKRLLGIQKRSTQRLTIVVIAHTPKRDPSMPILMRNLAGSMNLANFAKSIVAISKSSQDPDKRYIKHIKCRNGRMMHGHENVIGCTIIKEGTRLEYDFNEFSKESEHLVVYDNSEFEESALRDLVSWRQTGMSFRKIEKKLRDDYNLRWSHTTISRKYKAYVESPNGQLDESDRESAAKNAKSSKHDSKMEEE